MSCIPDSKTTDEMYLRYLEGLSLADIGKMYCVSRQTVYKRFERAGLPLRQTQPLPYVVFLGEKYTLRNTGYYGKTRGKRTLLHRDMWEASNGKIPKGYDVHHIDENRQNNKLSNFRLLSNSDYTKLHGFKNNQHTKGK